MTDVLTFLRRLLRRWFALLSCAVFTVLGLYELHANKSNKWSFYAGLTAAGLCFLAACFLAWRDEYKLAEALRSEVPVLKVETLRYTWLIDKTEDNQPLIQLYICTRLSNVGRADTTIQKYALTASGPTGALYRCKFRSEMPRRLQSLASLVTSENPLKRGLHCEGWLRFDFVANPDPVSNKREAIIDCELSVTDAFGQKHSGGLKHVEAPYDRDLGVAPKVSWL